MEALTIRIVEVVAALGERLVEGDQLDHFAFRAIGGLVEYEATVLHMSLQGGHLGHRSVLPMVVVVESVSGGRGWRRI
jgi:hypothetical protein